MPRSQDSLSTICSVAIAMVIEHLLVPFQFPIFPNAINRHHSHNSTFQYREIYNKYNEQFWVKSLLTLLKEKKSNGEEG